MDGLRPQHFTLNDGVDHQIDLCGKVVRAHMSGALYWPAMSAMIVADLHLGADATEASRSTDDRSLDIYTTQQTLGRLAEAIDTYEAESVVVLGGLHDGVEDGATFAKKDLETLAILQRDLEWIWIQKHMPTSVAEVVGGYVMEALTLDGIRLQHMPQNGAITHEISGGLHPAARLASYGTSLRRACFVGNGRRLILPAFGVAVGGENILDETFAPLLGLDGMTVLMLGQDGVYPVAPRLLDTD